MGMRSFQKNATFWVLLQKNVAFFAFFYILCKRTFRSLPSFTLFAKNVAFFAFFYFLCKRTLHSLRSYTFLRKERIVLLGFISRKKLEKRMQKHVAFFKRMQKNNAFRTQKKDAFRTQKNAVPNPAKHS